MKRSIRVGTRKSLLAMTQTELVINLVKKKHPEVEFEVIPMMTKGDRILDKPLLEFGGKGAFISELELAMQRGEIDIAVHSAKDMPLELAEGLAILAVLEREDPRDVLVTRKASPLSFRKAPVIGTGSLRRQQQIKGIYPVVCKVIRGNVPTRLNKLAMGEYDGLLLAAAGLKRLGMEKEEAYAYEYLEPSRVVPAAGQGIIAVEGREEEPLLEIFASVADRTACVNLETERRVLKRLNAGCNEPVGVYSFVSGEKITLSVFYGFEGQEIKKEGTDFLLNHLKLADGISELVLQEKESP